MRKQHLSHESGFTLIELLIVVAIIAILAAIAVPNFLEAQTRSKVSRSAADMRTIATGIEMYIVDHNRKPPTQFPVIPPPGTFSNWWGFVPPAITTPVAYLSSIPTMPFSDETVLGFWRMLSPTNTQNNQPYTYLRNTAISAWPVGVQLVVPTAPPSVVRAPISQIWRDNNDSAGYILYTSGPDGVDGTVWGSPQLYDPTNGTLSYGDIYRFGSGLPNTADQTN